MTQAIVFTVVAFSLVIGTMALLRWREDRKNSRRQNAITDREQENVALWAAKQTKKSQTPMSREE